MYSELKIRRLQFIITAHVIIGVIFSFTSSDTARSDFVMPMNTGCACPGRVLTYICTAVGTGSTQWRGTLFNCRSNVIVLRHNRYASGPIVGVCNGGAVMAQSVGVEDSCYTSQLTFTVDPSFNNKTVLCTHNSLNIIGTSVITVMEGPYSPPNNVHLIEVQQGILIFGWTFAIPNCTVITYIISSFNCGSCPNTTTDTNVTCSNLLLSSDESTCMFSVQSLVCDIAGQSSDPIMVILKVPDVPRVMIIPVYSNSNGTLIKSIFISDQVVSSNFTIANGISGSVDRYIVYMNSSLRRVVNSTCGNSKCVHVVNVFSSLCTSEIDNDFISVTVSAANKLGEGTPTTPDIIGCKNHFVQVEYNRAISTIKCTFQNKLDYSEKSCSIQYHQCSEILTGGTSENTTLDTVTLKVNFSGAHRLFCIIASNGTYTIAVDGIIDDVDGPPLSIIIVIAVLVLAIFIVVIVILVILLLIKFNIKCKGPQATRDGQEMEALNGQCLQDLIMKQNPVDLNKRQISLHHVISDCSLKEFVECNEHMTFRRGCAYYEFTEEVESIPEDKQLIFMAKDTKKYFTLESADLKQQNMFGERVANPSMTNYVVFIQSTGAGIRHLKHGSSLLYERIHPPLWRVNPEQCKLVSLENDCTLEQLCKKHEVEFNKCSIFRECKGNDITESELDVHAVDQHAVVAHHGYQTHPQVILIDKHTKRVLTGPRVHLMLKHKQIDENQWRAFVRLAHKKDKHLKTSVVYLLHEPNCSLTNTSPPVCISSNQFEKTKLNRSYEVGDFQKLHNLDCSEFSVFTEKSWTKLNEGEKHSMIDMLLVDKKTNNFYTGLESKTIKSKMNEQWKIFSSCRSMPQLLEGSLALYPVSWQDDGLLPVSSSHFDRVNVDSGTTLDDLYEAQSLNVSECDVFVELDALKDLNNAHIRDVILKDKETEGMSLFTGPYARRMVKCHHIISCDAHWMVFVLITGEVDKGLTFKRDASVLIQKHGKERQKFELYTVDEENIRMSKFITRKRNLFETGKTFYEFNQNEDLLHYKEIVVMKQERIRERLVRGSKFPENGQVECEVMSFYKIPDTPGIAIRRPSAKQPTKMFIQCTSQGSRNLKRGTLLLYKI